MLKFNKVALTAVFVIALTGCGTNDTAPVETPDSSANNAQQIEYKYKSPIVQPKEFILQKAEGLSDYFVNDHIYLYDIDIYAPHVEGSVDNKYGKVKTYLYKNPVPLKDSAIASGIGRKVIDKVNDIAKNPDRYGVEIYKLKEDRVGELIDTDDILDDYEIVYGIAPNGEYGSIYNPGGNDMTIGVCRYAFNNIIAYSIDFSVPDKRVERMAQGVVVHHALYRFGMNFDARTGEQITLKDVFADDVDYKAELSKYLEYRSFLNESPRIKAFNYDKMFLLTPTGILIGDNNDKLYCGLLITGFPYTKEGDVFFAYTHVPEKDDRIFVDVQYNRGDIPLKFFGENIAMFERYKTNENLFNNSVKNESIDFPSRTIYYWNHQGA
ncbi:MAG: hypothetical protein LBL34_02680 [Clostridiales bacterium]|jgi:hypothetical protein|nr:hypothetical protein [Clostridiales bacterium]